MSLRFNLHHPADEELSRLLTERLSRALAELDHLDGAVQRRATAVHNARKRLKESRALLRLVRGQRFSGKSAGHFNRRLRDLAMELSGQRDSDAMIEVTERMIDESVADNGDCGAQPDQSALELLERLRDLLERRRAMPAVATDESADARFELRVELLTLIDQLTIAEQRFDYRSLVNAAVRTYDRALESMQQVIRHPSIEHTHEMRKRMKDHWYQVRILEQLDPNKLSPRKTELKLLTETLGDYQDLSVLRSWLVGQKRPSLPAQDLALLMSLIGQRSWRLQQQALQQAKPLFKHPSDYWSRRWQARLKEVS